MDPNIHTEQTIGLEHKTVLDFSVVQGRLAYMAEEGDNTFSVIYGNQKVVGTPHRIRWIGELERELAYVQEVQEKHSNLLVIGSRSLESATEILSPFSIDGKIGYWSRRKDINTNSGWRYFIVLDGKRIGEEHENVREGKNIAGKLTYRARPHSSSRNILVHGDQTIDCYYDIPYGSEEITEVKGLLTFPAQKNDGRQVLVFGNSEIVAPPGKELRFPKEVAGELAYAVWNSKLYAGVEYVVQGNREMKVKGTPMWGIHEFTEVADKLVCSAQVGTTQLILVDGTQTLVKYENLDRETSMMIPKAHKLDAVGESLTYLFGERGSGSEKKLIVQLPILSSA